ncbi:hypothetical protein [uncultured Maribacter sp.]|uniref:hypothetical protein n=1 Tax=uncultured Maribacter sp. TaxID=431308 RepID=UPI00262BE56B|nr:hypothetical protein [uncultured Maribacter sp.]
MKSYQILKNEAKQKLKNNKKENAMGVISKSILKAGRIVRAGVLINSKFFNYE